MATSRTRQWALLAVVSSALLFIALDNSVLYTALPTLTKDLSASAAEGLWIINAYPVMMAGLLLGTGTLGDRIGHRRMFTIGLVIFGVASLAAAFAPSVMILIAARAVLAVGAASMMPATLALVRVTFTKERERNLAIAVWGSVSVIGVTVGPIAGGLLLEFFWWGSVFLVNVPMVLIALVLVRLVAPADHPDPSKTWDAISSLQAMVGLVGLVIAIKECAHLPPNWLVVGIALVASMVSFTLFVRRQRRLPYPLLDFSIFTNPVFMAGVVGATISMFATGGMELSTTQRFQLVEGFTPLQAGLLVAAAALGSLPTSLLSGAFLHRTGLLLPMAGGMAFSGVGVVIAVVGLGKSTALVAVGLGVIGLGLGAVMGVASTAIMGNASVSRAGMAASVEEVSYEFGNLTAVALLGSLLSLIYTTTVDLPGGTPDGATDSLGAALSLVGPDSAAAESARSAYDTGYISVMIVIAVVVFAGAAWIARLLRRNHPRATSSQIPETEEVGRVDA